MVLCKILWKFCFTPNACLLCQCGPDSVCLSCKDEAKASALFALKTPALCSIKCCTWSSNTDHLLSVPAFDLQLPVLGSEGTGMSRGLPFAPAGSLLSTYGSVCWAALSSDPAGNWSCKSTSLFHDHWELNQFCWLSPSFLPHLVPLQMIISQVHCIKFQKSQDRIKKQKCIFFR